MQASFDGVFFKNIAINTDVSWPFDKIKKSNSWLAFIYL